jgi:hypothetical protein
MDETPIQRTTPEQNHGIAGRVTAICRHAVQWIPAKARIAVLSGASVLAVLALYTSLSSGGTATLNLVFRHSLQGADVSVTVDGKVSYTDQISEPAKKRFGIFGKRVERTFSKSLVVASGEHVVQIHLTSAADRFDQTKVCDLNLVRGKEATLVVSAQQNTMVLMPKGGTSTQTENAGSAYGDSVKSILVTVIGSAVSAGIGFFVQELLRSRKTA